jgi:sugar phosphate isomerase/epimerase
MRLSVMTYTLAQRSSGPEFDLVRWCEFTRELGLDGVDIVTTYGRHPREVRRLLDSFGLKTTCYTFFAGLSQTDPVARQRGVDAVKRGIDTAVILGTDKIMTGGPGRDGVPREELRCSILRGFEAAMPHARQARVSITIENIPGVSSPFVTSADFAEAKKALPDLKLTFDCGNVLTGGEDPAESYRKCAKDVIHAHFKDMIVGGEGTLGLDGRRYRSALIGEGVIDHKACLQAMKDAGYKGYIDLEYDGGVYEPEDATRRSKEYLQELMTQLA